LRFVGSNASFSLMLFFRHAKTTLGQGAVQNLREKETYKKQANRYQYFCLRSAAILTSKTIAEMIENHSGFSCCANSYNKFVSIRSS